MDQQNIETRIPNACPHCCEEHVDCTETLLDGMAEGALEEAKVRLSAEGLETLMMVEHAADILPDGVFEAWPLTENINRLPSNDIQTLETYFARITMINGTREDLYFDISDLD